MKHAKICDTDIEYTNRSRSYRKCKFLIEYIWVLGVEAIPLNQRHFRNHYFLLQLVFDWCLVESFA